MNLNLVEFIENFVCRNTLIRLWKDNGDGSHTMIVEGNNSSVCMEHDILNDRCWQAIYSHHKVIGVTDIIVDDFYKEAVNIVIED